MKKLLLIPILMLTLAGTIAACGSSEESLKVTDAWTRVTTPSQETGAIYLTVNSPENDKLVKASVPTSIAGKTEIHETVTSDPNADESMGDDKDQGSMKDESMGGQSADESMHGGDTGSMMGMRHVSSIDLSAGEDLVLEPGGFHIMLFDLTGPIKDGDVVPVTLTFEKAGEVKVDATARES